MSPQYAAGESMSAICTLIILIVVLRVLYRQKPATHRETPTQVRNNRECDDLEDELHDIEGTL
jgi:hypothetical protein